MISWYRFEKWNSSPIDPNEIFKHFMSSMGGMGGFPFGAVDFLLWEKVHLEKF